jgi:integrase
MTDVAIRGLRPRKVQYKVFDGACKGLYLVVTVNGSRLWRLRYWLGGVEKTLSIGPYPAITLKDARQQVAEARTLLANGKDPGDIKRARKDALRASEHSFKVVALEWFGKRSSKWSDCYAKKVRDRLEKQLFPWLGERPVDAVAAPELLAVLRRIEARGALETAHRALQDCRAIFRYAISCGLAGRDVSADRCDAIATAKVKHRPALTDPADVGGLIRAIRGYQGTFVVACALRLAPLVFVRPAELRGAEWTEFDMEMSEWRIPGERMKMRDTHIVPLSKQAITVLSELRPLTGSGRYLFPSVRTSDRPISENTINAALRRLGYASNEMCGHGFKATASTLLNEKLGYKPDAIERQLAHSPRDKIRAAYNRAEYLDERRGMMQRWADYLDQLADGGKVITLPTKKIA